jgi:endonuclease YncB( thermonuclease family)
MASAGLASALGTGQAVALNLVARFALATLVSAVALSAWADIEGVVVGVSDGDTITVLDDARVQHRVRLAGIDAPEKGQAFSARSKDSLSDCAFRHRAQVAGEKIDRYGRLVGKVVVGGVDCNLRQVEAGLAWHYKQYQREQSPQDRLTYAQAEERAREARTGLWQDIAPQPPWDNRRERR